MKTKEYIFGIIIWGFISSTVTFTLCCLAADLINLSIIGMATWRFYVMLLLSNMMLTSLLIKLNN